MTPVVAQAALPIFGGLTYNAATATGYQYSGMPSNAERGISNSGFAIGTARYVAPNAGYVGQRVQYWTQTTFGTFPSLTVGNNVSDMDVVAVNASNTVIGNYEPFDPMVKALYGTRAFRVLNGVQQPLGDLGVSSANRTYTSVHGLNNAGVSVGYSTKYNGNSDLGQRAVLWKANGTLANELQAFAPQAGTPYAYAVANDISDNGVIVGSSELFSSTGSLGTRPARWTTAGVITQLGVLNTSAQGATQGAAIGVNKAGVILGQVDKYNAASQSVSRSVRYQPNSTIAQELLGLGVDDKGVDVDAYAYNIADSGLIVGGSRKYLGSQYLGTRPVYWTTSGTTTAIELPTLGTKDFATSGVATAANSSGVIAGSCEKYLKGADLGSRGVIWTTAGQTAAIELNDFLPANSPWNLVTATCISDTGFVSGIGEYASNVNGYAYDRDYSILVPQAGTYGLGDANFDTKVNFDDLVIVAQNYNKTNPSQNINVGDLNLDGVVNFDDLVPLAQHYNLNDGGISTFNAPSSASFAADWALAQSLVPEPGALIALAVLALVGRRQRA